MELNKPMQELLCEIVKETIEEIDETYREDEERKKKSTVMYGIVAI